MPQFGRMHARLILLPTLVLITSLRAFGAESQRIHHITIEDYFTQAFVTESEISPDGRLIAYVERRFPGPDKPGNLDIWIVDCASQKTERLTLDPGPQTQVKWSPDGKSLYFLGTFKRPSEKEPPYGDGAQVWRLELETRQVTPLTSIDDGVDAFEVGPQGKSLYFVESKKQSPTEWKDMKEDFPKLSYGEGSSKSSSLRKLDLSTWRVSTLSEDDRFIHSFSVSPDETKIALVTTADSFPVTHEGGSRVDILAVETGKSVQVPDKLWTTEGPSPYGWLESPCWSTSGHHLAFTVKYDGYPTELLVAAISSNPIEVRKAPRPGGAFVNGGIRRGSSNEFCFLADDHAVQRVMSVRGLDQKDLTTTALTPESVVIDTYSVCADGTRFALLQTELEYSRDIFLWERESGQPSARMTTVNPQIDTWKLPSITRIKWQGANGREVEGILELPPDHQTGTPLPLVVSLHGGPTACDYYGFQFWIYGRTQLSTSGYAVFCPNYRGSTGYGDEFLTDLVGHENEIEVTDIMTGIDHLIAEKIADPERLGVMGWSNGGYLTNCLITNSDRFKAASAGAGVSDMTLQWSDGETPGHVVNFQKGFPWTKAQEYDRASPLQQLTASFKTPLLLHAPAADERVPSVNSRALYRAVRRYLNQPTELVIYPDAGHSLTSYQHRLAKMKWDQAWFDKYLQKDKVSSKPD